MKVIIPSVVEINNYLQQLQNDICLALEKEDGGGFFQEDAWQHAGGGGGKTRVLSKGKIFERAGVNFSHVYGQKLPPSITQAKPELSESTFQALGISLVIHPKNPYVPTVHFNLRFFMAEKKGMDPVWWFGGGYDLTPYYGFEEDCRHWHQTAKQACDSVDREYYPRFKKAADEYFFLKHRQEPRGIGGIFFDYLNAENSFELMQAVGNSFIEAYLPIVRRRKNTIYGDREREFQCYRRGRYVEFNLIYDRGTSFGLQSGGRTESILMSLPPEVIWKYNWHPEPNSVEERFYKEFLVAREWV